MLSVVISLASCNHHVFDLKRTAVPSPVLTYYDNITMSSGQNFVYTVPMNIGTPAQYGELMVDINYPATIIWGYNTSLVYNGTTWTTASAFPWYLDNFFNKETSSTYELYVRNNYVSNIQSCGFNQ